jgi:hypothetical protein
MSLVTIEIALCCLSHVPGEEGYLLIANWILQRSTKIQLDIAGESSLGDGLVY